jgi:hypothetical protein
VRVSLKKSDVFIPDWQGNLDLPESEQVRFHYRFLGSAERDKYIYRKPMEYTFDAKGEGQFGKVEMVQDGKGIAMRMVTRIENLEVEKEDGTVVSVDNITDFYKHPMADLAGLVEAHMLEATAVVDTKN